MLKARARYSLFLQLGLAVTGFIFLIEGLLLVFSFRAEKQELYALRARLDEDVQRKSGKRFNDLHPTILSDSDIERRLREYARNIAMLTVVISVVVVSGTLFVFYWIAGRFIVRMVKLNRESTTEVLLRHPRKAIPNNEIGELIESREAMLDELESFHRNLAGKLRDAEAKIVHNARLATVGELTTAIVHDLRNPVHSIGLRLEMIRSDINLGIVDGEKMLEDIERIEAVLNRVSSLIDRMTRFSRSQLDLRSGNSIHRVIEDVIAMLELRLRKADIELVNHLPTQIPDFWGDPLSVEQVFVNLFSNSIDALEQSKERRITISGFGDHEWLKIWVRDSGPGIPRDIRSEIFNSFFTTKVVGKGTGLGLSICRQIMEFHHGSIQLAENEDPGAEFVISFRLSPPDRKVLTQ